MDRTQHLFRPRRRRASTACRTALILVFSALAPMPGVAAEEAARPRSGQTQTATQEQVPQATPSQQAPPTAKPDTAARQQKTDSKKQTNPAPPDQRNGFDSTLEVLGATGRVIGFIAVVLLAYAAYLLAVAMIRAVTQKGDAVALHSNWGGFGGGLGGWSLSQSFSLLLGAVLLAGLAVALANALSPAGDHEPQTPDQAADESSKSSNDAESKSDAADDSDTADASGES